MDSDSDNSEEIAPAVHVPVPAVEIAEFPDFNQLHPVIPLSKDLIQVNDLLGLVPENPDGAPALNHLG